MLTPVAYGYLLRGWHSVATDPSTQLKIPIRDGTVALNGVDFRLEKGETVALLGANGSGKTTFALHLNGLLTGEGTVEVCGLPVNQRTSRRSGVRSGWSFRTPKASFSCRRYWRMWPSDP